MRVLVYNCSGELDDLSHLFPNERMARIAAIARAEGCDVDLVDRSNFADLQAFGAEFLRTLGELPFAGTHPVYEARLADETAVLLAGGYDLLFLNLWHGTGFKFSMDLARRLKAARPGLRIIGVGQKVDWFKDAILDFAGGALDGLVTGLGYNAVRAIARGEAVADCPNTIALVDGRAVTNPCVPIDVDAYPAGDYSPAAYGGIAGKAPIHGITLSNQACPNACIFCVRPENYGTTSIRRATPHVLAEMRSAYETHGIRHFRFDDSTPPHGALTAVARAIADSDLAGVIRFSAFARIDTNREEDFALLRDAGCLALFFGVESLDDGTLTRLRKGTTVATILDTVARAHAAGITTVSSFIVPTPGETAASLATTEACLIANREIFDSVLALPAGVYPPTDWAREPARYDIVLDPDYLERFVTYPIRYLLPAAHWPLPPFRFGVMGKSAEATPFTDVIAIFEAFGQSMRALGIPCIPDYYYLAADSLGLPAAACTRDIVTAMIARDYAGLAARFARANPECLTHNGSRT